MSSFHSLLSQNVAPHDPWQGARIRMLMALRRNNITDTRVLGAIEAIPREAFVHETFLDRAYEDVALPIDECQTISQPTVVAQMTVALDVSERMTVLEIGTGSGYQAAILSKLARFVHTIERHAPLKALAEERFAQFGIRNIVTHLGDGSRGWHHAAPYDRIIVTASAASIPDALLDQLAIGGVMIIPVGGQEAIQQLYRIERLSDDEYSQTPITPVRFVPLVRDHH